MKVENIKIILKSIKSEPKSISDLFRDTGFTMDTIRKYIGYMHSGKLINSKPKKHYNIYSISKKGENFLKLYGEWKT